MRKLNFEHEPHLRVFQCALHLNDNKSGLTINMLNSSFPVCECNCVIKYIAENCNIGDEESKQFELIKTRFDDNKMFISIAYNLEQNSLVITAPTRKIATDEVGKNINRIINTWRENQKDNLKLTNLSLN